MRLLAEIIGAIVVCVALYHGALAITRTYARGLASKTQSTNQEGKSDV